MNHMAVVAISLLAVAWAEGASARPAKFNRASGGLVFSEPKGKQICLLSAQEVVTTNILRAAADKVVAEIHAPIEIVTVRNKGSVVVEMEALQKNPKYATLVAFIEGNGETITKFDPDNGRCVVDVRTLAKDGADKSRIEERVIKCVWRSVGFVLGAGMSIGSWSVLGRARTLAELDAIKATSPSPEQHNSMVYNSKKMGIVPVNVASYRTACQQGWAKRPQDEAQQKIWDEIHTTPSKPIKITYDKDKQKPVVK